MRRRIAAANWKMHKTAEQTRAYLERLSAQPLPSGVDVVIAPPFTSLAAAAPLVRASGLALGAQTMHWELQGAFTGEISAPMLLEFGVRYVILGHSERRAYCGETDASVNRKVKTALDQGLVPIVAVGETLDERARGETAAKVMRQTRAAFEGIAATALTGVVLAYEPIWAIGTGQNCDPAEADGVMATIRSCVAGLADTPILYGGSMNAENVGAYVSRPNIDGGLVGGASLDPDGFAALIRNAA